MPWPDGWLATIASPCHGRTLDRLLSRGTCSARCTKSGATGCPLLPGYSIIVSSLSTFRASSYEA